jgi:uncharacterized C2H2 Zn-finger protein
MHLIPYPNVCVKDGRLIRTCPECGEEFREETDAQGELTTNAYGEHYVREHGRKDGE